MAKGGIPGPPAGHGHGGGQGHGGGGDETPIAPLTGSSGGTASDVIATIADKPTADAIESLKAKVNALIAKKD